MVDAGMVAKSVDHLDNLITLLDEWWVEDGITVQKLTEQYAAAS